MVRHVQLFGVLFLVSYVLGSQKFAYHVINESFLKKLQIIFDLAPKEWQIVYERIRCTFFRQIKSHGSYKPFKSLTIHSWDKNDR
jgi:hypothetical protein